MTAQPLRAWSETLTAAANVVRFLLQSPTSAFGPMLVAMLAPMLASHDPTAQELTATQERAPLRHRRTRTRRVQPARVQDAHHPRADLLAARRVAGEGRDAHVVTVRLQGAKAAHSTWRSIVPMCMPPVVIRLTLNMATAILMATGLGLLGLGAQPSLPEWDAMIATGQRYAIDSLRLVT